jgi:hypothetical protein
MVESDPIKATPKLSRFLLEGLLALILSLLLGAAAWHLAWISVNVHRDLLLLLILLVAIGLYAIRHFFRMAYGILEILVGLTAIFGAMGRAPQIVDDPATAKGGAEAEQR